LVQPLEKNGCDRGNAEYYCEVLEKCVWIHQSAAGIMCGSSPIPVHWGTTIGRSELSGRQGAENKKGHRSVAFFLL